MICLSKNKDGADILVEYFDGTLDAERTAALERHAAECAECRDLVAVWNKLDEFQAPEVSPDFDARLYARIAAEGNREPWWKRVFGWKPALPVAAAACAALVLALMIRTPEPVEIVPDTKAEMVNMDQVEQALEDLDLLAPLSSPEEL